MGDGEDCAVSQTGLDHLQDCCREEPELFETVAVKKSTKKKLSDIMLADMESDSIAFDQSPHIDIFGKEGFIQTSHKSGNVTTI